MLNNARLDAIAKLFEEHAASLAEQIDRAPLFELMAALKALAGRTANAIIRSRSNMGDVKSMVERSVERLEESYRLLALKDRAAR